MTNEVKKIRRTYPSLHGGWHPDGRSLESWQSPSGSDHPEGEDLREQQRETVWQRCVNGALAVSHQADPQSHTYILIQYITMVSDTGG